MKFVIQRVTESSVKVDDKIIGQNRKRIYGTNWSRAGGYKRNCGQTDKKMIGLRIFEDENGKTNLSLETVGGSLLLISQFTLYANCKKGNRPSFIEQESRRWQKKCTNILSKNAGKVFR